METPRTPLPEEFTRPVKLKPGLTPTWLKALVRDSIRYVFDGLGPISLPQSRGESCISVAMIVIALLHRYGVAGRLAVGSARWQSYPLRFEWKGEAEYHAWVQTEFDEIVDLSCDALDRRPNLPQCARGLQPPHPCWEKSHMLRDRMYSEVEGGAQLFDVDVPGDEAFDALFETALRFVNEGEGRYRSDVPA